MCFSSILQLQHDHDYQHTSREGRVVDTFDKLLAEHEEFRDLMHEHKVAVEVMDDHMKKISKGQVFALEYIKENEKLFAFYTGLPSYQVFTMLFQYLRTKAEDMQYISQYGHSHHADKFHSKPGKARMLSLEEEMFLTLVRLRLGLPSKDLSHRFGIAESTFSNIFNTWVILIAQELEKICSMPPTDLTLENQAPCFDSFSNVRIVLDCTEVFAQTPGSLQNHRQIFSNYKHHSTVKFLVGMSPSGAIIYISDMWGGRASDKKITQESTDLLNALDAGNKVMVDRGFTIAEDLPPGVQLIIPPFKDKKTGQFTARQLEYSEKISVARIHVERAMRAIKEFRILESEVRMSCIDNFCNIFKACAFLVNFKTPFLKVRP